MGALHDAIATFNNPQIEWHLDRNTDINATDEQGNTPLMLLIQNGVTYPPFVQELLQRGADLHARNGRGMTALMVALDFPGYFEHNLALLFQAYEKARKSPSVDIDRYFERGRLALLYAVYTRDLFAIEALLDADTECGAPGREGRTPLMFAAALGRSDIVRLLLERGYDASQTDASRRTALSYAANSCRKGDFPYGGAAECVLALLEHGADPNVFADGGNTPLIEFAFNGDADEAVRLLLQYGADVQANSARGGKVLSMAAWMGREKIVRVLLEWGAAADKEELQNALRCAYLDNGQNTAPLLQKAGATVGIFEAIAQQDLSVIQRLLAEKQAKVNAATAGGYTPLMAAVKAGGLTIWRRKGLEIVRTLLEYGAEVNAISKTGRIALLDAAYFGFIDAELLLLNYGADANLRGVSENDVEETGFTMTPTDDNLPALEAMVRHGADVNMQNAEGKTALMKAARFAGETVVKFLLASGSDVNLKDDEGKTALTHAVERGKAEVVSLLLAHGADSNSRTLDGISALKLAQAWEGKNITQLLRDAGAKD